MAQGSRPERIGEELRQELSQILAREVHDPGIGFVTLTRVKVSPDLQVARVYYTIIGDDRVKRETKKALERATPFLRRHIAARVRLRRVPELHFQFDESVEKHDRIEQILLELQKEREAREAGAADVGAPTDVADVGAGFSPPDDAPAEAGPGDATKPPAKDAS
jgi:ribosome-binding factor A